MNTKLLDELSQLEAVTFEIEDVDALDQTLPVAGGSTSCCSCTSTSSCSSTSC